MAQLLERRSVFELLLVSYKLKQNAKIYKDTYANTLIKQKYSTTKVVLNELRTPGRRKSLLCGFQSKRPYSFVNSYVFKSPVPQR